MKKILVLVSFVFLSQIMLAQAPISKGQKQLNVGVGFSGWGLPVYVGLDFGVHPDISLGLELDFMRYRESYNKVNYTHSIWGFSGNGNYHFNRILNIPRPWDFYAGLNIGFYVWNSPNDYIGNNASDLGLGAQIGGRYYLNNKVALQLEFNGGNALNGGKFGLTIGL